MAAEQEVGDVTPQPFYDVLEATGYLSASGPVPGVFLEQDARDARRARNFQPDAAWCGQPSLSQSSLRIYFKYERASPSRSTVERWRQEVWNEGVAPLLWVISQDKVDVYNGFARPESTGDSESHRIGTFKQSGSQLRQLDLTAGRLAMETGGFWQNTMGEKINRSTSVDSLLLRDLGRLVRDLDDAAMDRSDAQSLIGRSIFAQYLVDRGIINADFLEDKCGDSTLSKVLRRQTKAEHLFDWLRDTFNGDLFPSNGGVAETRHLDRMADFLDAVDAAGQTTLFPYQFDIIPVELISSIYEQFVQPSATATDVHYTRLSLVSMVLEETLRECSGDETVLDLTCGSGMFLVEALRRMVDKRARNVPLTRDLIRETLYKQIFGMDISDAAVQVAAFSLYLTALELDPEPEQPDDLKFEPLIGHTLFPGDMWEEPSALTRGTDNRKFAVIVGNPPWSHPRKPPPTLVSRRARTDVRGSRGISLDFVHLATEYASPSARFGLVLGATQFFGRSSTNRHALQRLITELFPVKLVSLSNLTNWLFPNAAMPGIVLFARQEKSVGQAKLIPAFQVPWSSDGAKTHTFQVAPSDCTTLPLDYWRRRPEFLKAAFLGDHQDAGLLDQLFDKHQTLHETLRRLGTKLSAGLTPGKGQDAQFLHGLPFLEPSGFAPFFTPSDLPTFSALEAKRPRVREVYTAPLLIIKESITGQYAGRVAAAVSDKDTVFKVSLFGASFQKVNREAACLLAGIIGSSLASWFFLMTAADFGVWLPRVKPKDVGQLRVPDVGAALRSDAGQRIVALVQKRRGNAVEKEDWQLLDEAVFELYDLPADHRIVVRDGLTRAGWEWKAGRKASVAPARSGEEVKEYARVFADEIDSWLQVTRRNRLRAEVYDLPFHEPLRAVRFVLEVGHAPPIVEIVPCNNLRKFLDQVGGDLSPPLTESTVGHREVQCYGRKEIVIVRPAARRHWMAVRALGDATQAIIDGLRAR